VEEKTLSDRDCVLMGAGERVRSESLRIVVDD
jgi:hypothetical protein